MMSTVSDADHQIDLTSTSPVLTYPSPTTDGSLANGSSTDGGRRDETSTSGSLLGTLPRGYVASEKPSVTEEKATASYAMGRLGEAHSWTSLALQHAENAPEEHNRRLGSLFRIMSAVLLEWNDTQRALTHATAANKELASEPISEEHVLTYLQLATSAAAAGRTEEASSHLDEARQTALTVSLHPEVQNYLMREHVATLLDLEQIDHAQQWLSGLQQRLGMQPEDEALALRLLIKQGKLDGIADRGIRLVRSLPSDATLRARVSVGTASAAALDAAGRRNEALVILSTTVQIGEPEGYVRSLIRYREAIAPLMQSLRESGPQGRHVWGPAYLDRLVSAATTRQESSDEIALEVDQSFESLSERELQVLRLLGGTLSNREIGAELYLSVNTVKTHVKSVYAKLGVNRRAEAVSRGKSLGLLRNINPTDLVARS